MRWGAVAASESCERHEISSPAVSSSLSVAFVGLGNVAERIHWPAIKSLPGITLTSGCDTDVGRRERVGQALNLPKVYGSADELFREQRPDIAIVGTPPFCHLDDCLVALRHGAHVFCEKPFVESVADAEAVIAAALAADRVVAINNQYRYMAMYRESQRRIAAGEFGRPFLIQAWEQMNHPPFKEKNWRAQLVQSTLFEFGTHALDLICFFFDALPETITVLTPHPRPDIAADVVVTVMLRFPGERVATMVLNRISQAPERYFEMRVDCEHASLRLSLGGVARATLDWSKALGRPTGRVSFVKGGEARVEAGGRSRVIAVERQMAFASATGLNFRQFLEQVRSGGRDRHALYHQRALIRLIEAGYESARRGGETMHLTGD